MSTLPKQTAETTSEYLGIPYVVEKSCRRSCMLNVRPDGIVVIRMPLLSSTGEAEELIRRHRRWIIKRINKIREQTEKKEAAQPFTVEELNRIKREAKKKIAERVAFFAPLVGVDYGKLSFRFQHSRWGSCTRGGNLSFNSLLVLTPPEVLDSVVVHELCHRKEMNHSARFYYEVLRVLPEYKKSHAWLKLHGDELLNRLP